jgi:hypothetical protein
MSEANDRHEHEADRVADAVTAMAPSARSVGELAARTARLTGAGDLSDVVVHGDAAAAAATAAVGARAFAHGRHVYFGSNELRTDTVGGRHLVAHELAHVVQQRTIGARVQRQMPIPLRVATLPLSTLHEAAKALPCTPFATVAEADAVEDALETVLLPSENALFGSEVEHLWANYLSRQPGDSLAPIRFDSPGSEIVQGFAQSDATREYHDDFLMEAVWAVMPDFCGILPVDEYFEIPVDHLLPESVLTHDVIWGDAFDLPANIAGESGPSDAGMDARQLSGSMTILRLTDEDGRTTTIEVEPHFRLTVTDAIDFCPGNMGAGWQAMFTIPMSRLEASGAAYDLPFVVEFDMPGTPADATAAVLDECNARSASAALPPELGVPEPDCSTRVSDVFLLGAIDANPERPECSFAQIHERKDHERNRQYRADHPLPATPCPQGDARSHDFWLGGRWRILDITTTGVTVLNACGDEETLGIETGFQPPATTPAKMVPVAESQFGPGTVELYDNCRRVIFRSSDGRGVREYALVTKTMAGVDDLIVYVPTEGEKIDYPPSEVERMLHVQLQGDKCGEPLTVVPPDESFEGIPGQ